MKKKKSAKKKKFPNYSESNFFKNNAETKLKLSGLIHFSVYTLKILYLEWSKFGQERGEAKMGQ